MEEMSMLTCARARLEMEIREISKNPPNHISFGPTNSDDVFKLQAIIMAPIGTPYEGCTFQLSLEFPSDYPFRPPQVKFQTEVYHPNIAEDGTININILEEEQWTPALTIETLLLSICSLLMDPIVDYTENAISDPYLNYTENAISDPYLNHNTDASPDDHHQSLRSEVARLSIG